MSVAILHCGDSLAVLRSLPPASARCCVTSPPYFGLRDYGHPGQVGLEPTPDAYIARLVEVFREVRRVLTDDGTLWLNMGDTYAGSGCGGGGSFDAERPGWITIKGKRNAARFGGGNVPAGSAKPKDLLMIPARVALGAPGGRLVPAHGHYLVQAQPHAGERAGPAHQES